MYHKGSYKIDFIVLCHGGRNLSIREGDFCIPMYLIISQGQESIFMWGQMGLFRSDCRL
jgi:hypothetical protein